jgi:Outer membrane protein beta-barrel domain
MKRIVLSVTLSFALCVAAAAQVEPAAHTKLSSQITLQGSGLFAMSVTDSGVTYKPTSTAGVMTGYRFYFTRWVGVEGDYDYFRNAQKYSLSNTSVSLKTNVNVVTGAAVVNIPNLVTKKFQSFALVGGGAMILRPSESSIAYQTTNVIVFGGGIDIPVTRHIAIRGQAKTFLYKAPDFQSADLKVGKFTQAMIPSVGVVYKF